MNTKPFCERESGESVYYELYVDVLFLVNFMMDYLLLLLVKKMLKCSATHGNIFFGALIGAGLTCAVVIIPIPYAIIKTVLFHTVINTCMIRVGLKIKTIRAFVKAMIMLYIGSVLLGGILEMLRQYVKIGSLFFFLAVMGYYLALGIWKFISCVQKWNRYHCEVELFYGESVCRIKGLVDTGNGLCDPISGEPVSIIDKSTAKKLLEKENMKNVRYIPYRTIGNAEGVLPIIRVDRMRICGEESCDIKQPLLGISEERVSIRGEYEMILNPNLF